MQESTVPISTPRHRKKHYVNYRKRRNPHPRKGENPSPVRKLTKKTETPKTETPSTPSTSMKKYTLHPDTASCKRELCKPLATKKNPRHAIVLPHTTLCHTPPRSRRAPVTLHHASVVLLSRFPPVAPPPRCPQQLPPHSRHVLAMSPLPPCRLLVTPSPRPLCPTASSPCCLTAHSHVLTGFRWVFSVKRVRALITRFAVFTLRPRHAPRHALPHHHRVLAPPPATHPVAPLPWYLPALPAPPPPRHTTPSPFPRPHPLRHHRTSTTPPFRPRVAPTSRRLRGQLRSTSPNYKIELCKPKK